MKTETNNLPSVGDIIDLLERQKAHYEKNWSTSSSELREMWAAQMGELLDDIREADGPSPRNVVTLIQQRKRDQGGAIGRQWALAHVLGRITGHKLKLRDIND